MDSVDEDVRDQQCLLEFHTGRAACACTAPVVNMACATGCSKHSSHFWSKGRHCRMVIVLNISGGFGSYLHTHAMLLELEVACQEHPICLTEHLLQSLPKYTEDAQIQTIVVLIVQGTSGNQEFSKQSSISMLYSNIGPFSKQRPIFKTKFHKQAVQ